jgi:signal transduction histidine kinase
MRALVLSFLFVIFSIQTLEAAQKKNILVLLSYHSSMPWTKQFMMGLEEFSKANPSSVEFFIEQIDAFRLDGGSSEDMWVEYIKDRYKNISFDGILVESFVAATLFRKVGNRLYPDIPAVVLTNGELGDAGDVFIEFDTKEATSKSVDLALSHNKNLNKVYIIHSDSAEGVDIEKSLIEEFKKVGIEPFVIKDFTKKELLDGVANLPQDSAIFYTVVFKDKNKEKFIPKDLLTEITKSSSAPVYVFYSSMMGEGALGGVTQDGRKIAKVMIEALLEYIESKKYTKNDDSYSTIVDWRVMNKLGIKPKNNPENVVFINKLPPIWESYPKETLFASVVFLLLVVIVAVLVLLGLRNKKIEDIEKKMLIQSRHAAMGEMLSAIAHQWRQPLNTLYVVFQNYKMLLASREAEDENIDRLNKKSEKLINQMSQTIDDFKDFFKPSREISEFKPKDVLLHSVELIDATLIKDGIDVKIEELSDGLVCGFPNDLGQCFINILQNARDALKTKSGKKEIKIEMKRKNGHILISFYDNGGGIEPKILPKVFEPYVTTKEHDGGTGIGLYMTKTIIEEHMDGKIEAKNFENGACFIIELKVSRASLKK